MGTVKKQEGRAAYWIVLVLLPWGCLEHGIQFGPLDAGDKRETSESLFGEDGGQDMVMERTGERDPEQAGDSASDDKVVTVSTWSLSYGGSGDQTIDSYETPRNALQTTDNGFMVVGSTDFYGEGGFDVLITKISCHGVVELQKTFGNSSFNSAVDILRTSSGIWVIGNTSDHLQDLLVLRIQEDGELLFQKVVGGNCSETAMSMVSTKDGGILIAGASDTVRGALDEDIWVVKMDADGELLWQKIFGGEDNDFATSILELKDSSIVVAGSTKSFGKGGRDGWVLKLDSSGEIIWQKTYGEQSDEEIEAITESPNNNLVLVGYTESFGSGSSDAWILEVDTEQGDVLVQNTYGAQGWETANSIQKNEYGYVVAGTTWSFSAGDDDLWLFSLDQDFKLVWQKSYGFLKYEKYPFLLATKDGGLLLAGTQFRNPSDTDSFLLKLDAMGDLRAVGCPENFGAETKAEKLETNVLPMDSNAEPREIDPLHIESIDLVSNEPDIPIGLHCASGIE